MNEARSLEACKGVRIFTDQESFMLFRYADRFRLKAVQRG